MTIYELAEKMNDGDIITEIKNTGRKTVTIKMRGEHGGYTGKFTLYTTSLPTSWPDADCATVALGQYMMELIG
jgi:hypothetical protein